MLSSAPFVLLGFISAGYPVYLLTQTQSRRGNNLVGQDHVPPATRLGGCNDPTVLLDHPAYFRLCRGRHGESETDTIVRR